MAMDSRQQNVFSAKLAEKAERYDEMALYMDKVVEESTAFNTSNVLTVDERDLLHSAYRNLIGDKIISWRTVSSIEKEEENRGNDVHITIVRDFKANIEKELASICERILNILDWDLIPVSTTDDSTVFYLKMKGDYHRYRAEFMSGNKKKKAVDDTVRAYSQAQEIAKRGMAPTHPLRLNVALNFVVFYYEVMDSPNKACDLAKEAFDVALPGLDTLSEESYKDSTRVMRCLRDNLIVWTNFVENGHIYEIKDIPTQTK